jgi:phenylacetate-CoA ligase
LINRWGRQLVGNAFVCTLLFGQRAVPFASRRRIECLRDARVRRMVRHAAATVPFYREAFRRMSIDPGEIRTADDLARLPLVEKEDVRRDPQRFVSTSRLGRTSIPFVTSGSTGTPVHIHHDRLGLLANIAFGERERKVITSMIGAETGYREAAILYPGGTVDKVRDFYRENIYFPIRPDRLLLSVMTELRENVDALNDFRPDVLLAYGSYLHALSRAVSLGAIRLAPPKLLIYAAEPVAPQVRREIEDVLGAPMVSRYNAVEAFKIAFLCEQRNGFHVHEDLAHLRILGADARTLPDGESGCVVLSNLVNRATVLLNYRLSDVASFMPKRCPCGRTLRLLAEVDGRVEDMLTLDSGKALHPRAIWSVIKPRSEIIQYQLIQQTPTSFLLKLVTVDEAAYLRVSAAVACEIGYLLGSAAAVRTVRCAEIPREAAGKVRMVVALPAAGSA